jgi:hypothetical protein
MPTSIVRIDNWAMSLSEFSDEVESASITI